VLVLELILAASDVDAVKTAEFVFELTEAVPAVIAAANDEEAVPTVVLVFELTALVIPEVCELVFELI